MKALGQSTRTLIGISGFAIVLLCFSACGARVTSGDENTVLVKAGPLTSVTDAESIAQEHCAQYGKRASVEGSDLNPATLQDSYRFNCVVDPQ